MNRNDPALVEAHLLRFARALRDAGLWVGPGEVALAVRALAAVDLRDRAEVRLALRTVFAKSPREQAVFDRLFARYWRLEKGTDAPPPPRFRPPDPRRPDGLGFVAWARGQAGEALAQAAYSPHATEGSGAALGVRREEVRALERATGRVLRALALLEGRRWRRARQGRGLDLRRALRRAVARGGEVLELPRRSRDPGKARLVFLLDVSGSMELYQRLFLEFAYALVARGGLGRVEVFAFSTDLWRLTPALCHRDPGEAIRQAVRLMPGRSGGTRIGASLQAFLDRYGHLVDRQSAVVILSDGWDTGALRILERAMREIARRAGRVVWLNPLAGLSGYAPEAGGMRTALPYVDVFAPAHDLESLLALPRHLKEGAR